MQAPSPESVPTDMHRWLMAVIAAIDKIPEVNFLRPMSIAEVIEFRRHALVVQLAAENLVAATGQYLHRVQQERNRRP